MEPQRNTLFKSQTGWIGSGGLFRVEITLGEFVRKPSADRFSRSARLVTRENNHLLIWNQEGEVIAVADDSCVNIFTHQGSLHENEFWHDHNYDLADLRIADLRLYPSLTALASSYYRNVEIIHAAAA